METQREDVKNLLYSRRLLMMLGTSPYEPITLRNSKASRFSMALNTRGWEILRFLIAVYLGNCTRQAHRCRITNSKSQFADRSVSVPTTSSHLEGKDTRGNFFLEDLGTYTRNQIWHVTSGEGPLSGGV